MNIIFLGATNYSLYLLKELLKERYKIRAIFTLSEEIRISYSQKPVRIFNYANLKEVGKKYDIPVIEVNGKMMSYYEIMKNYCPD